MKNKVIVSLFIINVVLLAAAAYLGIHTGYVKRNFIRLGIIAAPPQDSVLPVDYWCIRGWTNTLEKLNVQADIVFFGNSITCGSSFQEYFPDKKIINLGYPGDNIQGMFYRIDMLKAVNPHKCFIMAGINDSWRQKEEIIIQYRNLISQIKDEMPEVQLYIESILPVNSSRFENYCENAKILELNTELAKIAEDFDCQYIDLYTLYVDDSNELPMSLSPDGVHLFRESYDRWAEVIRPYIYE